ncbi:MAG: hypothetical protein IT445_20730 [Phycisphaeraceae bacterium]|nr:hypothetical protein [Phycisphaeraceae bacterium]
MNTRRSQHGISTFIAIAMLTLVSISLVSIERHFAAQHQRTHRLAAETQLRQLLLAGAKMVDPSQVGQTQLVVPPNLGSATLVAQVESGEDPQQRTIELTATVGEYVARQRLVYRQAAGGIPGGGGDWVLSAATLSHPWRR